MPAHWPINSEMTPVPKEKSTSLLIAGKQGGVYKRSLFKVRSDNETFGKYIATVDNSASIIRHRMDGRDFPAVTLRMGNVAASDAVHVMLLGWSVTGKTFDKTSRDLLTATGYRNRKMHLETGDTNIKRLKIQSPFAKMHVLFEEFSNAHGNPGKTSTVATEVKFK